MLKSIDMIKVGTEVGWPWMSSLAIGVVLEIYSNRHEIISKGKHIVRNGTVQNPALVIRHSRGSLVLKLASEVQDLSSSNT